MITKLLLKMAENIKSIVVDASVVLAWILADERSTHTDALYEKALEDQISLNAPTLLISEVINSLKSAVTRKRATKKQAQEGLRHFFTLDIQLHSLQEMSTEVLDTAIRYDISGYDAQYVALAKHYNASLYTLDTKLKRKIAKYITVVVP